MKITKLFSALSRTRSAVKSALNKVLSKEVEEDTIEELESQLITADLGVHTVEEIMVLFREEKQDNFLLSLKKYLLSCRLCKQFPKRKHKFINVSRPCPNPLKT